jgi:hypothetical protein
MVSSVVYGPSVAVRRFGVGNLAWVRAAITATFGRLFSASCRAGAGQHELALTPDRSGAPGRAEPPDRPDPRRRTGTARDRYLRRGDVPVSTTLSRDALSRKDLVEKIALFRYQLIRESVDEQVTPRQRGPMVRVLAGEHLGPFG